jgi:hypothetical protein
MANFVVALIDAIGRAGISYAEPLIARVFANTAIWLSRKLADHSLTRAGR